MSAKEIKKLWKDNGEEARNEGTKLHKDIENFYNKIDTKIESPDFHQFLQFYEEHKDLKIYRTEWFIFCDTFLFLVNHRVYIFICSRIFFVIIPFGRLRCYMLFYIT